VALQDLAIAANYSGDADGAVQLIRQAERIAEIPAGSCWRAALS
jgi:hypothetical protein